MTAPSLRVRPTIGLLEPRLAPAVFTVNDNGDDGDFDPTDNKPETESKTVTLRAVMEYANAKGSDQDATIHFSGPMTINVGDALPYAPLNHKFTVDASDQASGGKPGVAVVGKGATGGVYDGFNIGNGATIRAVNVSGFHDNIFVLTDASGVTIEDCYLGTNMAGDAAGTKSSGGITTKGPTPGITIRDNVVSGNTAWGIRLNNSAGAVVTGNKVGTDRTGQTAIPNGEGFYLATLSANNAAETVIGGPSAAQRNIVSGNSRDGVYLIGARNFKVQGNYIGVAADGSPLGNQADGVYVIQSSTGNTVGGGGAGEGNVIGSNQDDGVNISGGTNNLVQGNFIGVLADKTTDRGNGSNGVAVGGSGNVVGAVKDSDDHALGNTIAYSGAVHKDQGSGVLIASGTGNTVRLNSILMNERLGIDVGENYVDQYGRTTGANAGLWHPTVVRVVNGQVHWMFNAPAGSYTVDLYTDPQNKYTEYAEGANFYGTKQIQVDDSKHYEFDTPDSSYPLVATATDANGNTSEFSLADGDGDGLCDTWETTTGIDMDGDGTAELILPRADRTHRDLYLEYDSMTGWGPLPGVVDLVVSRFADQGITLHAEPGNQSIAPVSFPDPDWPAFQAFKQANFASGAGKGSTLYQAKLLAYRYVVFGVDHGGGNSSGRSEILGNDSMVTLGGGGWFGFNPDGSRTTAAQFAARSKSNMAHAALNQAGTFIHEFGHALGLGHRGPVEWNGHEIAAELVAEQSPGFRSSMNYLYQAPGGGEFVGPAYVNYSSASPNEWGNIWFAFQEHPQSTANGTDLSTTPDDSEPSTPPVLDPAAANLVPSVFPPPSVRLVGAATELALDVVNTGPATAAASTFAVTLPDGLVLDAATASQGTAQVSGNTVLASFGDLTSFNGATLTLTVRATRVGQFVVSGHAATSTVDGRPADNDLLLTLVASDGVTSPPPPPASPSPAALPSQFAVGADVGGGSVRVFNADQTTRFTIEPFPGFTGGVRVATADFNRDGVAELIAGTGPGGATHVRVLDGATQAELFAIDPFEAAFVGGVYVAVGDLDGDGTPDLLITPDQGGGPRVRVFSGRGFGQLADFFGIDDPNFRGGARAAVGDITGDGRGDLVVAAGFGGGPRLAVYDGTSLAGGAFTRKPVPDFFAFEQTLRNGVFVTAGDLDGDGLAELIAGGGPGGGPRVSAFSGAGLLKGEQTRVADFFAGDPASRGGIRLAVKALDDDSRADLVVGSGSGAGNRVTAYRGRDLSAGGTPASAFDFDAVPGFTGGVFVG